MSYVGKIGVGIITSGREEMFKKCFDFHHHNVDHIVVINDGDGDLEPWCKSNFLQLDIGESANTTLKVIQHSANLGVAASKNEALEYLYDKECDHIFLMEQDMYIKNQYIFNAYIEASQVSGIQHFMFGYHGPANKNGISGGRPVPRLIVKYPDDLLGDVNIALNMHCVGAFCYYSRESIKKCGYFDPAFRNAFDHVAHSYHLTLNGFSTPYWWWADLANSLDYIGEQACSSVSSSIVSPEKTHINRDNFESSYHLFKSKYGVYPFGQSGVGDIGEEQVLKTLKLMKNGNRHSNIS